MSGPTAGLPAGYPSPPAQQQQAPSGLVQQQYVGPYMYGRMTQSNRPDLNPLNSRPAIMVKNMARKRINEYLREQGIQPIAEHEEIPAMFIVIELMHLTMEPLRTDANRAFRDMPVKISTSQTVRTVWRRQPYEAVPYEARTFPFHVARQLLQQIENYSFTIYPELVQQGNMTMWKSRPLNYDECVQVAPEKWREPTEQEKEAQSSVARKLARSQGIASRRQGGQGALLVNLDPQRSNSVLDANATQEAQGNPDVRTFKPAQQQPVHRQPAPTPEYPQPQPSPAGPPTAAVQQYAQTPQGQQMQQPQPQAPAPAMQSQHQVPVQQAGTSTSMKSDLHEPLQPGEIPETVKRTQQGKDATPEDKQEVLTEVGKRNVEENAPTNNPPPPRAETTAPPPPPPPPTR